MLKDNSITYVELLEAIFWKTCNMVKKKKEPNSYIANVRENENKKGTWALNDAFPLSFSSFVQWGKMHWLEMVLLY